MSFLSFSGNVFPYSESFLSSPGKCFSFILCPAFLSLYSVSFLSVGSVFPIILCSSFLSLGSASWEVVLFKEPYTLKMVSYVVMHS